MEGVRRGPRLLFWPGMGQESSFRTSEGLGIGAVNRDLAPGQKRLRGPSLQGSGSALREQNQPLDWGRAAQHFKVQVMILKAVS